MESNKKPAEHCTSPRRGRAIKKRLLTVSIIAIALCIVSCITLAYVATETDALKNIFSPSQVASEVIEDIFDGVTKSNVRIKNVGNTTAYMRAAVVVTWMSEDGSSVAAAVPEDGTDYSITFNDGANSPWEKSSDGFWYYTTPVEPTLETEQLIVSCSGLTEPPAGFYLSVEITASAIQSSPANVVKSNWDSGVSDVADGVLVVKK